MRQPRTRYRNSVLTSRPADSEADSGQDKFPASDNAINQFC